MIDSGIDENDRAEYKRFLASGKTLEEFFGEHEETGADLDEEIRRLRQEIIGDAPAKEAAKNLSQDQGPAKVNTHRNPELMTDQLDITGEDLESRYQKLVAEELKSDEELEGLKTEPQRSPSRALMIIEEARFKSTIHSLEKALEASIREMREAVNAISSVQYNIVGQCKQSKAKAVESHKEAQASLSDHNMTGVFLHSTNKTAHIKIVQILREQAGHAESKASSLRKCLASLERLKTQFQTQAKLVTSQASNPSPQQVVQPPSAHLDDYELVNLKKQLDDL